MHPVVKALSLEERDLLVDTITSDVFTVYCKVLAELSDEFKQSMLKYNLANMTNESLGEFALLKARQQGADSLLFKFTSLKQQLLQTEAKKK